MKRWGELWTQGGVALVAVLMMAGPGVAQQATCANLMTQVEINFCTEADFLAADAELNVAYTGARERMRQVDSGLPAPQRGAEVALRDGQRAWITFRDRACEAEAFLWTNGSGRPMAFSICRARLTRQRTADLWSLAQGY